MGVLAAMSLILGIMYGVVGLALVIWAAALSVRYNAWTNSLREGLPNFNRPPTPEWLALNTKIMTVMFRVAGAFFILASFLILIGSTKRP
jgi:uncharacterized membrane protein YjgN (DUF898 family)